MSNKPVFTRRLNSVEAAIWQNESEDSNWHNITFQRTYRDEQGVIQNTSNFRMDDLPALAFMAVKAYDQLALTEDE